nr:MAG TPA: hypothetical protein [Caudoviricetes sp.]
MFSMVLCPFVFGLVYVYIISHNREKSIPIFEF